MKKIILTILATFMLAGAIMPAFAGIVQDATEKVKEKARELLEIPAPEREITKFEKIIDGIAGKYVRLKKCLKGEQACNKSDFLILATGFLVTYSFILGIRNGLQEELLNITDSNSSKNLKFFKKIATTIFDYDPLIVAGRAGKKMYENVSERFNNED